MAKDFEQFINGLVEEIEEEDIDIFASLSEQQIIDYYTKIDLVIVNGKPKEIDRLLGEILSTNNDLIRYLVEKMRKHEKAKVHFNLLLFLSCCAEGENKGIIKDDYLMEVLKEFSASKNKDVKDFALYSLKLLTSRLNI
ncbi:hypothetical protein [Paenisporosarcina sp. TG-14]|uniref:hypothetical protein n=1 Tax=Paenisporosarcina sp. TG-14 TaxID=1231057 RepID=UPI000308D9D5|nr:hypothetical protein [Paenisporosarcina sp. TG-14]